jgi:hypothetical protein
MQHFATLGRDPKGASLSAGDPKWPHLTPKTKMFRTAAFSLRSEDSASRLTDHGPFPRSTPVSPLHTMTLPQSENRVHVRRGAEVRWI